MDQADDPIEIIKTFVDAKIQVCRKYLPFVKLYTRERLGDRFSNSDLWWKSVAPLYEEIMAQLAHTFQSGIDQGSFRSDIDPADMAIALDGLTDGFMYAWLMAPDKNSFAEKKETITRLFIAGVRKS